MATRKYYAGKKKDKDIMKFKMMLKRNV